MITSAPNRPRVLATVGPAMTLVMSRILIPLSQVCSLVNGVSSDEGSVEEEANDEDTDADVVDEDIDVAALLSCDIRLKLSLFGYFLVALYTCKAN